MDFEIKKRGQVTIFIVVAILIVVAIILFFLLLRKPDVNSPKNLGPEAFIEDCVGDLIKDSISRIMINGGENKRTNLFSYKFEYMSMDWNYLCYQSDYYLGCYNVHPMLEDYIEEGIWNDTASDVQECFDSVKNDFENQGYDIGIRPDGGDTLYSVDLRPGYVYVNLSKEFYVSKDGVSQNFDDFSFRIISPAYDLMEIARRIVNSEARSCGFDYVNYMWLYPKYHIQRINYYPVKLYTITDRDSGDEFKFVVRGCVSSPGI